MNFMSKLPEQTTQKARYRGVIPPMITLFALGTTGEAPSLSYRLRCELIGRVCELAAGRVPVLVGITDTAFVESVQLANVAAEAGAEAVVLSTPYYFPAGQTELIGYVERICQELPLPVMLYNIPVMTKVGFEWDTLQHLSSLENIIGVKDSGGDFEFFKRVISLKEQRPDWSIFIGPEHLLARAVRAGADGGVAGGANVFPELFVKCFKAVESGDEVRADLLDHHIQSLQKIYDVGKYTSRFIKATKCAVSLLGICDDILAEPFDAFKLPERAKVAEILASLQPDIEAAMAQTDREA